MTRMFTTRGPALCPGSWAVCPFSLGQTPSLHSLRGRRRTATVVRGFSGTMGLSDSPRSYIVDVSPWGSSRGPWVPTQADRGVSRFPYRLLPRMRRVFDPAGRRTPCLLRCATYCLPSTKRRSAPETRVLISGLNTVPARSPVNASAGALPPPPHNSGPLRLARPSTLDSFIPCYLSAFIGAFPCRKLCRPKQGSPSRAKYRRSLRQS